jgi:hypothetical protein
MGGGVQGVAMAHANKDSSLSCHAKSIGVGMAERVGFEPTVGVNLHTLSKRAP